MRAGRFLEQASPTRHARLPQMPVQVAVGLHSGPEPCVPVTRVLWGAALGARSVLLGISERVPDVPLMTVDLEPWRDPGLCRSQLVPLVCAQSLCPWPPVALPGTQGASRFLGGVGRALAPDPAQWRLGQVPRLPWP